ncbi:TPA: hypothetical protein ACPY3K_000833 [Enterobacter hormaechei subsp. xiangfangensis]|jgi:hypothetical protein|uniref:Uncharacterized protein n=1 Tax=Enterobacter hormaechei TaxID=158836 RepID=A0A822WER2_9ENTR|nr:MULTISPECIES: hypothetical protein [Enterobacter cloacae complex]DAL52504.1 MAG TPA_asm: hypothetical protein [Caudoviricetes sp.]MDF3672132.1 hypothetical protein [Enterobacter hormaechei]MDF3683028.1 hypothetical protein [Enterobacter hormaechei]MDF3688736.1 hypothetical protein [Enterobacter hormaechei]MDN4661719.1 hypothetical protein [Enterobacter cloacae complex sp. 2023EL-00494]
MLILFILLAIWLDSCGEEGWPDVSPSISQLVILRERLVHSKGLC